MYNWRRELIERLIKEKFEVHLALPYGNRIEDLKALGCKYTDISIDRRGKNIYKDLKLIFSYLSLIKRYHPDIVLTYGTKPNIYGGMVCRLSGTPYIENINGLGSGITSDINVFELFMQYLYKISVKNSKCTFFQNKSDRHYCLEHNIVSGYNDLLPGSGVNLEYFNVLDYPEDEPIVFTYIARIMKEKGIDEFLEAAEYFCDNYPDKAIFNVLGFCEESYELRLKELQDAKIVNYYGMQDDVRPYILKSHCIVMPSFYGEGMSNVLLESAACGRPIITTDLPGCGETLEDGVTGFVVKPQSAESLINVLKKFMSLSNDKRKAMGLAGRKKMETEFNRQIVVEKYMEQIRRKK